VWLGLMAAAASSARAEASKTVAALSVKTPITGSVTASETQRYLLALDARVCAFGVLSAEHVPVALRVFAPEGVEPLRQFDATPERANEYGFCGEAAGNYRLEVVAASGKANFTLKLEALLPRTAARPKPSEQLPQSPRLRELNVQLATRNCSTSSFWQEVARSGAPLVERLDSDHELVTFLWHGDAQTHAVSLQLPAWTYEFADPRLALLPDSDIWFTSVRMPNTARMSYRMIVDPALDASSTQPLTDRAQAAAAQLDPLNPVHMLPSEPSGTGGADDQKSVLALPNAPPEKWLGAPAAISGKLESHTLDSALLSNRHELVMYTPPGYTANHAALPLLILFDGESYLDLMQTPRLLDALIAAHEIKPLLVLFVKNATSHSRSHELPCNARFVEFLASELLPFVREHYAVTRDPSQVALGGSSFGGLAASFGAYRHPELFGLVLSQSGSYWWTFPRGHADFDGSTKAGWLARRMREHPLLAIRYYLSAGSFERAASGNGVLENNRSFRDVLRKLGYAVIYQEFVGGHDHLAWRATLPDALRALFGTAPAAASTP
jgi:enterochelin esterase-like enzyme